MKDLAEGLLFALVDAVSPTKLFRVLNNPYVSFSSAIVALSLQAPDE